MPDINRDELHEQLRAMVAGRGDGIDLDTPFHWVVEGLKEPATFFEHLPIILPRDSILYFEGVSIAPDVAAFYSSHRARHPVDVARDTIAPVPDIYHCAFSPTFCDALRGLSSRHPVAEMFHHIKGYRVERLLFTFHDAFDGWLRVSEHVPEESLARFCQALGVSPRREETKRRDPEQLRRILWMLENPDKVRIREKSWLERIRKWWRK